MATEYTCIHHRCYYGLVLSKIWMDCMCCSNSYPIMQLPSTGWSHKATLVCSWQEPTVQLAVTVHAYITVLYHHSLFTLHWAQVASPRSTSHKHISHTCRENNWWCVRWVLLLRCGISENRGMLHLEAILHLICLTLLRHPVYSIWFWRTRTPTPTHPHTHLVCLSISMHSVTVWHTHIHTHTHTHSHNSSCQNTVAVGLLVWSLLPLQQYHKNIDPRILFGCDPNGMIFMSSQVHCYFQCRIKQNQLYFKHGFKQMKILIFCPSIQWSLYQTSGLHTPVHMVNMLDFVCWYIIAGLICAKQQNKSPWTSRVAGW